MRKGTILTACIAPAVIAACGGGGGGDNTGPGPTAAAVQRFAGDSQVAPAGTTLPESLSVLVSDSAAHPVAGVSVQWSVTGGGSVSPTTSLTGLDGVARAARTLGTTAGTAGTGAAVASLAPVQFTAVGQVQGGVTIASATVGILTDTVLGTLFDPEPRPAVLVTDQQGTPVAGVNVVWSAGAGGAVTSATVPTGVNGVSAVGFTFGAVPGPYAAHATVTGLQNSPIDFSLTATAGVPALIAIAAGDDQLAAPSAVIQQTVKVTDGHGNPVAGVTIDWSASNGGGSVNPTQNNTAANGQASTARTLGTGLGAQTTAATASGVPGSPAVSFNATSAIIVAVANNSFSPNARTITTGDSIVWKWQGVTANHNLTFAAAAGAPANAPDRNSGVVWRLFTTPGTFNYQCTNHVGMTASITVTP